MNEIEIRENLNWTLEATPQKYDTKEYIIYTERYGKYSKRDARVICDFMRSGAIIKIFYDVIRK